MAGSEIILEIESYRQKIREKLESVYDREAANHAETGRYPFEGRWRSREQIVALQQILRKKDRRILLELMVVFLLMAGCIAFLFFILTKILPL